MRRLAIAVVAAGLAGCGGGKPERAPGEPAVAAEPEREAEPRRADPAAAGGNAADPGEPAPPPEEGPKPGEPQAGLPEVVAEIDGEPVTREEFLHFAVEWWGRETMEEIVLRRILDKAVRKYGVTIKTSELDARIEGEVKAREAEVKQKHGITLEQYLKEFGRTVDGFRKELRESENFTRGIILQYMVAYAYLTEPKVRVRHIVVPSREKADELRRRLQEGADFAKLAEQETDDDFSAPRGGELQGFIRGMSRLGDDFEDTAFALQKPGDLSAVVKTERGFHLLKLIEKTPANPQTFEAMRAKVIEARMDRMVLDMWMKRLRREYARVVKYHVQELEPKVEGGR
ncbi:MAG: peptidylprolyl isomerase [Planctomycetes bacterium]|nr:peptidylprolyl isomerase [Planctomycetota bacterium]